MKNPVSIEKLIFPILLYANVFAATQITVSHRSADKVIVFGNNSLTITLDYNKKCNISQMDINRNIISGSRGIFSEIVTSADTFSTLHLLASPQITTTKNTVLVSGISYGDKERTATENWKFTISEANIVLVIERDIEKDLQVEQVAFPAFHFNDINTWDGALLGNGGVAWFYLFNERLCTYGVHTDYAAFWNNQTNTGLKIKVSADGKQIASRFSRSADDQLVYAISVSDAELVPRYDADTQRRRFIRQKTDVWDSLVLKAGKYNQTITLTPTDCSEEYGRGKFAGVDGDKITNLLNTIARIGVIDAKHFGANSWHTPYGPICLHEQYIGQLGIAINDPNYLDGYKECLDFYRDNAVKPDGRVFPRWAYDNSDMMEGEVTPLGFYEAQWGYLLDSNTDLTINVCELYNQSGDIDWVRTHKKSCEAALEYLLRRDSNNNNLVEMLTDYHSERKSSDWIDIIWACFENAFVNAKLYHALTLWSEVEKQLGDDEKAQYYSNFAGKLKKNFNKTVEEGGFWDNKNKWYVHWRDKDNSIHGNNLVTPVNFMAIAYDICDYPSRRSAILAKIESQMKMENLFFWPICLYPYQTDEGLDYQFPFPYYENGDLFLSWGGVGVESYAKTNPDLALKYIENVLKQYDKDGLAFQRYARINQEGAGDDILAGNCLAIVGLYKAIYGINPLHNRLYLNPHLPEKLAGTELYYNFRNDKLKIGLAADSNSVSNDQFRITCRKDFGFYSTNAELFFFNSNDDHYSIAAKTAAKTFLSLDIRKCDSEQLIWNQVASEKEEKISYTISILETNSDYSVAVDDQVIRTLNSGTTGTIKFDLRPAHKESIIKIAGLFPDDAKLRKNTPGKNILKADYKTGYSKYDAGGKDGLYDGERGTTDYRDGTWQGFEGEDLDITFELKQLIQIGKITMGFLESTGNWIYLPVRLEVYVSRDGKSFEKARELTREEIQEFPEDQIKNASVTLDGVQARYVRILAKNINNSADLNPIAAGKEWIFCDEVIIE